MRKALILLTVFGMISACSVNKKPEFTGVENIKVIDISGSRLKVSATANFRNPNDVGGILKANGIKVYVNDVETATLFSEDFKVPARESFGIPLTVEIPTDSIIGEKSIMGLLGSILSKEVKIKYEGPIKYQFVGFSHSYMIDRTDKVKIKF